MSSIYDVIGALADFAKAAANKSCPDCNGCDLHKELENLLDYIKDFRRYEPKALVSQSSPQFVERAQPPLAIPVSPSKADKEIDLRRLNDRLQDVQSKTLPLVLRLFEVIELLLNGLVKAKKTLGAASNATSENAKAYATLRDAFKRTSALMTMPIDPLEPTDELGLLKLGMETFSRVTDLKLRLSQEA